MSFANLHFFEPLMDRDDFRSKRMFGGLALYYNGKMIACLMEDGQEKTYRGKEYKFALWDGILFPTDFIYQQSLLVEFKGLVQHPVLKKWLYLPAQAKNFEPLAEGLIERIRKNDERLGIFPSLKKRKPRKRR